MRVKLQKICLTIFCLVKNICGQLEILAIANGVVWRYFIVELYSCVLGCLHHIVGHRKNDRTKKNQTLSPRQLLQSG
jgi:hypothetical protein